jgi:hypothetical protein
MADRDRFRGFQILRNSMEKKESRSMKKHRGLVWAVGLAAMIGFMAGDARAGTITMTVSGPGFSVPITPGSPFAQAGSSNTSLTVNTAALNAFLAANGSGYTFSDLGATSNYPGAPNPAGAQLSETGTAVLSGPGTNVITISTVLDGYTAPTGTGSVRSTSTANFTNTAAGDTQASSTSYNGGPVAAFLFTATGTSPDSPALPPVTTPVGTVSSGFSLDNSTTITLSHSKDQFTVSTVLTATGVPEPASLVMMLTGMPLPLVVLGILRRRRAAA